MLRNDEVVKMFTKGLSAQGSNLHSTGNRLYSYGWWEMARWVDGKIVVRKGKNYSPTTVRHMSLLRNHKGWAIQDAWNETPVGQGEMNL